MRATEIMGQIASKRQQIELGVGADREHILRMDIIELEDELSKLEQSQELPPEEVTEVVEPILATVDTLPLETYTDYAELIRTEVSMIIEGINNAHKEVVDDLKNKLHLSNELELSLKQRNVELEKDYQICANENLELLQDNVKLEQEKHQLTIERDEAFAIRNNAIKQLEGISQELEEAKSTINRNRELKALTEAERTAAAEAERQKLIDSRVKIYNMRHEDEISTKWSIANLAETGELTKFETIYKGRYTIVTEDEALALQAMNQPITTPELTEEVSQELFQEEASVEGTLQTDESEDQGEQREVDEVGTPETFEERTERRLNAIERRLNKDEPEFFHEVA